MRLDGMLLAVWESRNDKEQLNLLSTHWGVIVPEDQEQPVLVQVALQMVAGRKISDLDPALSVQTPKRSENADRGNAVVPIGSIERLGKSSDVEMVSLVPRRRPKLDRSSRSAGIFDYRKMTGATGRGVLLGIIDTGIDGSHPAFRGNLIAVWDQTSEPPNIDADHAKALLVGEAVLSATDEDGHGTHVAGIAAGRDNQFGGVAPDAEIVVVKCEGSDSGIEEGIRFILAHAATRPVVINLSWGSHSDPHDGTDPLCQYIDSISGPGRIVCCAAGNEGDSSIHARLQPRQASPDALGACVEFEVKQASHRVDARTIELHGWLAYSDQIAITLESPSGLRTESVPRGSIASARLGDVDVTVAQSRPRGGLGNFVVVVTTRDWYGPDPTVGTWKLLLRGNWNAPIDIWLQDEVFEGEAPPSEFVGPYTANEMRIGGPGASKKAITVANYVTRNKWKSGSGERHCQNDRRIGAIAPDSSDGPLRDGTEKPDIAAPGSMIVAPRSRQSGGSGKFDISHAHRIQGGTSMAAPFVAGAIALLLQDEPSLTPEEAKRRLASLARPTKCQSGKDRCGAGLLNLFSPRE